MRFKNPEYISMYKHQPQKRSYQSRTPLTFLHGRVKNTIQAMFYKEKHYGWVFSKRTYEIDSIFNLLNLPDIFNVEGETKAKFNKLVAGRFDTIENEIILTVADVAPAYAEKTSRVEERDDILRILNDMKKGDRLCISIRNDMKRVRRDAPDRVIKIFNLEKVEPGVVKLVSEYDFTRATYPIDEAKAVELAKRLLDDEKHEIHAFVRENTFTKVTSLEKLIEETLTNWTRVY